MKKNKIFIVTLVIGTVLLLVFLEPDVWNFSALSGNKTPVVFVNPTSQNQTVSNSATQMAKAGNPIPTNEIVFIQNQNLIGLRQYLDDNAQNWVNMSINIHSGEVFGDGVSSETVKTVACDWNESEINILCHQATVEYTAVYKGVLTAGTNAEFLLRPQITLKNDLSEISRVQEGDKIVIKQGSTVQITFSGRICITSVEESTPSSTVEGSAPPTNKSYTLKSLDQRKLWPDLGPNIWPTGINEDALRLDAYKKAKDMALQPEKVEALYSFVEGDLSPGGKFRESLSSLYTPQLAELYGLKGFEIILQATPLDFVTRCDGTPINK